MSKRFITHFMKKFILNINLELILHYISRGVKRIPPNVQTNISNLYTKLTVSSLITEWNWNNEFRPKEEAGGKDVVSALQYILLFQPELGHDIVIISGQLATVAEVAQIASGLECCKSAKELISSQQLHCGHFWLIKPGFWIKVF